MQAKIKFIIIVFLAIAGILATHIEITPTETKIQRSCVTECSYEADEVYLITVEYDRNLYEYYDSVPRDIGTVLMVTYNEDYEIIDAYEEVN